MRLCNFVGGGVILAALCVIGLPPAQAQRIAPKTIIADVSVVDVRAGKLLPHRDVVLSGERIVRVVPTAPAARRGAMVVDGKGRFLMPGLFDSHVHLNNPTREAPLLVANGVTYVRDMGGETGVRIAQRAQARRGEYFGMEIACVGTIVDGSPAYHPWSRACATPDEGRAAVRELKAVGVDQIKVYVRLRPDVHRAICDEARRLGLKTVGHVPDSLTLTDAVAAGQRGVEHLTGMASLLRDLLPDFKAIPGAFDEGIWARYTNVDKAQLRPRLRTLAATGTVHCPTLTLHLGQARLFDARTKALWSDYATLDDRRSWEAMPPQYAEYGKSLTIAFPALQQMTREMQQAHVPLIIGTDLANVGLVAGFAVHLEMQLWQDAGIAPADVLRAATLTPARFLGVDARLGTVEAGKTASLVLTRRNPLQDVRHTSEIEAVWARGRYFARTGLDRLLAEAREDILTRSPTPGSVTLPVLPGEIVARGRYNLLYEQYGDGQEEFVITRDGDTYRYAGLRRQGGFGRYPVVHSGTWDLNFAPKTLTLAPQVLLPTVESYKATPGRLRGTSSRKSVTRGKVDVPLAKDAALRASLTATDFFLLRALNLSTGETRQVTTILLSATGATPERQTLTVTRLPDETLPLGPRTFACRRYALRSSSGAGPVTEIWADTSGLPVKQVIRNGGATVSALLDVSEPPQQ